MLAHRDQRSCRDRHAERRPADRTPAAAEVAQYPRARLALEPLRGRNGDEDERNRAADPDDRGKQMNDAECELQRVVVSRRA
jgi:hypothetical protein